MKRSIDAVLRAWRDDSRRKPLLIRGARQVGKSWSVHRFGKQEFTDIAVINLEAEPQVAELFRSMNPREMLNKIEILTGQQIVPGKTLLFIDEIQAFPKAVSALRYFYEEVPELHVIAAGSLLEPILNASNFSMPVGRIEYLYMKPLSFEEFLLAQGQETLAEALRNDRGLFAEPVVHNTLLDQVRQYLLVGGMPEVVAEYQDSGNYDRCRHIQTSLLQTYRDDFNKYATRARQDNVGKVFESAVQQVGNKFKYAKVDPDELSRNIKTALELLALAGVYHKVIKSSADGLPLGAGINERFFKVLFLDVGLMQNLCGLATDIIRDNDLMGIYRGALMEQFVGQELIAYQDCFTKPALYYWAREAKNSSAEIDYVCQSGATLVPIEVKAGKTGRLKSLHRFLAEKQQAWGIRISSAPLQYQKPVLSIPFYMVRHWQALWEDR